MFAFDVPQRDVDGGDGAHDGGASEGGHAVEVLPVVFDAQGVLADEVVFEDVDDGLDGGGVAPAGGLAEAGEAGVGGDADYVTVADEEGFDFFYFHFFVLRSKVAGIM